MSDHNFRPASGLATVAVPIAKELADFDALPVVVRRALDDAPCGIDASSALAIYRRAGTGAVLSRIADVVDQHLDACETETGVPRPKGPLVVNKRRKRRAG